MNAFFSRPWAVLLLAGLAALTFRIGVVPALRGIEADFPGYYTAARIVVDGRDTDRLYDDDWFREQIRSYGLDSPKNPGKFAPFPPPTALLLMPLARTAPLTALRAVTAISLICLLVSILLLAKVVSWTVQDTALFVLSSALGIASCLRNGQPYILVSTSCIAGYFLYLRGKPWLAGVCLGLFVPIKYYPVILLAFLGWRRQWKVLLGGGVTILGIALLSIGVLGWQVHQIFLASVLGNHLTAQLTLHAHTAAFTPAYQSFDTLFNRLFLFDPELNPQPLLAAPLLRTLCVSAVKAALVLLAAAALIRVARNQGAQAVAPSVGLLGVLVLLIAPATATYTFTLLWLPVGLLIQHFLLQRAQRAAYFVLGTYVLIGFLPLLSTDRFDGRGALTVLAYPRLWVLSAMFIGAACLLVREPAHTRRDEGFAPTHEGVTSTS